MPADTGTISENDIKFLQSLNRDIPVLIIISKAEKKDYGSDLSEIKKHMKDTLDLKGIKYEGIFAFSNKKDREYDKNNILNYIKKFDKPVEEVNFAFNFKKLFFGCKRYYDKRINDEEDRLRKLQKSLTCMDSNKNQDVEEWLESLVTEIKKNIQNLTDIREKLYSLQNQFFSEIKVIGDIVHIKMPEPNLVDLIKDKITDPLQVLHDYRVKQNIEDNPAYEEIIQSGMEDITEVLSSSPGGSKYKDEIYKIINDYEVKDRKTLELANKG